MMLLQYVKGITNCPHGGIVEQARQELIECVRRRPSLVGFLISKSSNHEGAENQAFFCLVLGGDHRADAVASPKWRTLLDEGAGAALPY
jgi:hypothetical protein